MGDLYMKSSYLELPFSERRFVQARLGIIEQIGNSVSKQQAKADEILKIICQLTRLGWQRNQQGKVFLLWLFCQALSADTSQTPVYLNLALFFAREGDLARAKRYWHRALVLDPDYSRRELWAVTCQLQKNLEDQKDQSTMLKILRALLII